MKMKIRDMKELIKLYGVQIECQENGSNNPEDLVDGIFLSYERLKELGL